MMDNLEIALEHLFKRVPVQEILTGHFQCDNVSEDEFVQLMRSYSNRYSDTELKNLFNYLDSTFADLYYSAEQMRGDVEQLNVFELLRYYSCWLLRIEDDEIVCEYWKFLHWRYLTQRLSEDLLVTSFLAKRESGTSTVRTDFGWKAMITHNNRELHKILSQGIAENHSHLKGASPIFQLNWINLMNFFEPHDRELLEQIEKDHRTVNVMYKSTYQEIPLSDRIIQAAAIRAILFSVLTGKGMGQDSIDQWMKQLYYSEDMVLIKKELIEWTKVWRKQYLDGALPDYAIAGLPGKWDDVSQMTLIFQGERWLMYSVFRLIYSGDMRIETYKDIFYAYLVIKESFRAELVQSNDSVGFENFKIYENRKDMLLSTPFFSKAIVKKAVEASLFESNVVVSEQRIAPRSTAEDNRDYIQKLDSLIDEGGKYRSRFFYTVHFIKEPDRSKVCDGITCRHVGLRQKCREEAVALAQMRERYPAEAARMKGIDAANTEIGCGPEVFAQAFRFLSNHFPPASDRKKHSVSQLRITYHVGEDFLDMASGLRAIDEAIHFLGMRCGDRLGHALALGVDVEEWYAGKNYRLLLTQQEYLDNLAWMYHMITVTGVQEQESIKSYLRKEYEYYFHVVYGNAIRQEQLDHIVEKAHQYYKGTEWEKFYTKGTYDFSIENYYSAWKLRGDAPEMYTEGYFDNSRAITDSSNTYSHYALNRSWPNRQNKRYFKEIGMLYYFYHYNPDVRREGAKTIEKKISRRLIQPIIILQREMQQRVARAGIAVETNPSSNVLIGTFKRYDKHPIMRFYNRNLTEDIELIKSCPQLNVSINTDDSGIFNTSLENEYAYLALALEKAKDKNDKPIYKRQNIYEWLNSIREMGLRQTFLSGEEAERALEEWRRGV